MEYRLDLAVKLICKECRDAIPIIHEDFKTGDLVCGTCGMVLGNRIIDTRSEWRTFNSADEEGGDPSRVGSNSDPLMTGSSLDSTTIASDGSSSFAKDLSRTHAKTGKLERQTETAYREIQVMCERIGLSRATTDSAKQLFRKVCMESVLKGKTQEAIIASCIYVACREQNVTRTFKEIYALTKVSKKDIGRCFKAVQSLITDPLKTSSLDSFISRFSSFLEVKPDTQNNALKVANQVTKLGILDGKSPITLVAACLLFGLLTSMLFSSLALNLSTATKPPTEIAAACGCTEGTMKNAYRLLYERKEAIVEGITFSKAVEQLPVW